MSSSHVDDELLAAAAGSDTLTESEAGQLSAHLAECASCRARREQLMTVRRALAALPPAPMPPDVLSQLQARLAAEPWPAGRPATRARREHAPLLPLSIAAGLALVAGVTAVALHGHSPDSTGGASSAAGAVREVNSARAAQSSAAPQANAAKPGAGGVAGAPSVPPDAAPLGAGAAPRLVTTGRDYHHATLAAGATDLALSAQRRSAASAPGYGVGSPLASAPASDAPSPSCLGGLLAALSPGSTAPLQVEVVDAARYDGRPALVMVIVDPQDSTHQLGLAVAGSCTEGSAPLLDQVVVGR
ncbi:MAG TPA: hypothetical protein VGN54_05820 [Mycobacteriales bacterium]|nr:hypothetical protein [Mycobacteriales bacterium]